MDASDFISNCEWEISTSTLKSLVEKTQECVCVVSGAKKVVWEKSEYIKSGSGAFGLGNKRGRYQASRITFEF